MRRALVSIVAVLTCCAEPRVTATPPDDDAGTNPVVTETDAGITPPPVPVCGDGHVDTQLGEACDDGNDSPYDGCRPDCTVVTPVTTPARTWTWFDVPGTQCMDGKTAGFAASINPDSPNLMIYLEGGGACFNDACDFSTINVPYFPPPDGIFNRDNDGNPVRDWSMVYVPYCTGDIHGGDADTELGGAVRHFHGYSNITRFLELWTATFPGRRRVLLTGISAGGFGAGLNFPQVADAFAHAGAPEMSLIDDSGPPFGNDVIPRCLQENFRAVWGLDRTVLAACGADCTDPDDFATGIITHVAARYPDARMGVFSNSQDTVIRTFMGFGWGNGQHDNCGGVPLIVPADAYGDGLLALRARLHERAGTFFVGANRWQDDFGLGHTALRSPTYWTTVVDGVSVEAWLGRVINGEPLEVGP